MGSENLGEWLAARCDIQYGYNRGCLASGHDERWCSYCEAFGDGAAQALTDMLPLIEACIKAVNGVPNEYDLACIQTQLEKLGLQPMQPSAFR